MVKNDCKRIERKLSRYLDNEVSAKERMAIESHLKACSDCAAEKQALQKLSTLFRQVPDILPAENSEALLWEKLQEARKPKLIERIRSFITQWDFMPVYYPVTALLVLGLMLGVGLSKAYDFISYKERPAPTSVEYLALNRMDTIPFSSFAGVYLSGTQLKHENKDGA